MPATVVLGVSHEKRSHLLTAALTGLLGLAGTHEAWSLVLYTASNEQLEKIVIDAFREAHPDIKVESVNMSTGPITQRLIAEKEIQRRMSSG